MRKGKEMRGRSGSFIRDFTASKAIEKVSMAEEAESERYYDLLDQIDELCDKAGFEIADKIILRDLKTGKVWK
jgi:hypothetical protein